jgi:hypothetical protein
MGEAEVGSKYRSTRFLSHGVDAIIQMHQHHGSKTWYLDGMYNGLSRFGRYMDLITSAPHGNMIIVLSKSLEFCLQGQYVWAVDRSGCNKLAYGLSHPDPAGKPGL